MEIRTAILVVLLVALSVASSLVVFFMSMKLIRRGHLSLVEGSAYLTLDGRHINITAINSGELNLTVVSLTINGSSMHTWTATQHYLEPGQNATIDILLYWVRDTVYNVSLSASSAQGTFSASTLVRTPNFENSMDFYLTNATVDELQSTLSIQFTLISKGYDWAKMDFFAFKYYQHEDRPIYVFLDDRYMPQKTVKDVRSFLNQSRIFGLNVQTVDWASLSELAQSKPKSVLCIFQPLINRSNEELYGALPACLIDPDQDGHVRDDSKYGRSLVYDWEKDQGLIFVTIGGRAALPNIYILYQNETSSPNLDKKEWPDASLFFTDSNDIFVNAGAGGPGTYIGSKITKTLGLHEWFGEWGFWNDRMEALNMSFYGYSSWILHRNMNLSMPCFIKVGSGGWLSFDNFYAPWKLDPESLGYDLAIILFHSVWDGVWLDSGWNYDSKTVLQPLNGGQVTINGTVRIFSPREGFKDMRNLLIFIISYNSENSSYTYDRMIFSL